MLASEFRGRRPRFSNWVRHLSYVPLHGLTIPCVRMAERLGAWGLLARMMGYSRPGFGEYSPDENDVIVCSYFKSGTNWMLQIALQVLFKGEAEFDYIHDAIAWPDRPPLMEKAVVPLQDSSPRRCSPNGARVIKTHLAADRVPINDRAHYIALVRDPKDVCVSAYHMLHAALGPAIPSISSFVETFLNPLVGFGYWPDHLSSYWALRHRPNLLFLTYEQIGANHAETIDTVSEFIGVELNDAQRLCVLQLSGADHMRRVNAQFEPGPVLPWSSQSVPIVRNARSSASSSLLSPELQTRIDDHFRAELRRLSCDFPYEAQYGADKAPRVADRI